MRELPTGTVTFLFTDIEGSTALLQRLGDRYRELHAAHGRLIRQAVEEAGGVEVSTEGDSFFCAFPTAPHAVRCAVSAQEALTAHPWPEDAEVRVRMGLHTGEAELGGDNYVGIEVHRTARIAAAAHGGQVLLSESTRALAHQHLPEGVTVRDLGPHRLKDLSQPEPLFQLVIPDVPSEFPPPRTLEARPHNLPVQLTSFVGRAEEVAETVSLLRSTRLLTLTGSGGTGKTRLALQVAAEMVDEYSDGVFFVPLASVVDPEVVPSAIASTLGLHAAKGTPRDQLAEYLRDKEMLLVLDNFEQVLPAGQHVASLLQDAAKLEILVTSRAPLHLYGEREYPVPPLRIPRPEEAGIEELVDSEAVQLFVERAGAVRPGFALSDTNAQAVAEIATRLEGLPLAIELAAARVKVLSPEAISSRLHRRLAFLAGGPRNVPTRQQTLRDAISWSYELLEEPGQMLFRRMAPFRGGATLSEAETVCGPAEELGAEVLDGLGLLVDQSLLRQQEQAGGEPRFFMLETIREFALERLEESEEEEKIRRRYASAFLELVHEAEPHLTGEDQARWLDRLEREHDNLRAVLDWALEHTEAETALQLAGGVWRFWQIRGHLHEGRRRLGEVLDTMEGSTAARAKALEAAGGVAYWQGDFDEAKLRYQGALELVRALGDREREAEALYNLSFTYGFTGGVESARQLLEQSLAIFQELGDRAGEAKVLWGMGSVAYFNHDLEGARSPMAESVELFREQGNPFNLGWAIRMLGRVLFGLEGPKAGQPYFEESLRIFSAMGDLSAVTLHVADFLNIAVAEGDAERAAVLYGAMTRLQERTGADLVTAVEEATAGEAKLEELVSTLDEKTRERATTEGAQMSIDQVVDYCLKHP